MKVKYFDSEHVFDFIAGRVDENGIWHGDADLLAGHFGVSEEEAHEMLTDLAEHRAVQLVGTRHYLITNWREDVADA